MSVLLPLNSAATVFSLNLTKGFHFYNITIYIFSSKWNQSTRVDSGDVNTERRVRFLKIQVSLS